MSLKYVGVFELSKNRKATGFASATPGRSYGFFQPYNSINIVFENSGLSAFQSCVGAPQIGLFILVRFGKVSCSDVFGFRFTSLRVCIRSSDASTVKASRSRVSNYSTFRQA